MRENNPNELMIARVADNKVVIELPIDLLVKAQLYRPESPYKITDEKAMAEYVTKNILDYDEDQDDGTTAFNRLIDELFDYAFENAEEWLQPLYDAELEYYLKESNECGNDEHCEQCKEFEKCSACLQSEDGE